MSWRMFGDSKLPLESSEGSKKSETEPKRGSWSRNTEYILSCLGLTVGLGNIWRFPYVCYKNGGGSFLIPYTVMLFFLGMPLFFLEASIGQYSARSPIGLFKHICPLFSGLGYTIVLTSFMGSVMYSMVIGWTSFYFFDSFRGDVRWQSCSHKFNSEGCFSVEQFRKCKEIDGQTYIRHMCYNSSYSHRFNVTDTPISQRISPAEEYFNLFVLNKSTGIGDLSNIEWRLLVCLLVTWTLVFLCCFKGIKSSGKVVYFTATFPYFALIIMLIRGLTMEGSFDGIMHFLTPNWKKMITVTVWQEAAVQIFFTTSVASGGIITFSSYNKFHNNIVRDTLIVTILNSVTSFIAGLTVFAIIGYMAKAMGLSIEDVAEKGPNIAFITFADAISHMPASPAWAILFFLMLFMLSLDSMFGLIENVVTSICDDNIHLRPRKWMITLTICLFGFILGIPLTTGAGIYIVELVLTFLARPMIFLGIMECVVVAYFYGIEEFMEDVKEMVFWKPSIWVKTHIQVVLLSATPFVLMMILLIITIDPTPLSHGSYIYPTWAIAIGWVLSSIPILVFTSIVIYVVFFTHKNLTIDKRIKVLLASTSNWRAQAIRSKHEDNEEQLRNEQFN